MVPVVRGVVSVAEVEPVPVPVVPFRSSANLQISSMPKDRETTVED